MACGRVTGLFGANSSGKTSIPQFLLLLKQTREATDRAVSLALGFDLDTALVLQDATGDDLGRNCRRPRHAN